MSFLLKALSSVVLLMLGALSFGFLFKKILKWRFLRCYLSDYLPFETLLPDGKTVVCKEGTCIQFVRIQGPLHGSSGMEEDQLVNQKKKSFFDAMAHHGIPFRLYTRKKHLHTGITNDFDHALLGTIHEKWEKQFLNWRETEHTLIMQASSQELLEDYVDLALDYLAYFRPFVLGGEGNDSKKNQITSFLGEMVNVISADLPFFENDLCEKIAASDIRFDLTTGIISMSQEDQKQFWSVHSLKSFGDKITPEIFEDLTQLPLDVEIVHFFQGMPQYQATTLLKYRLKQENIFYKNALKTAQFDKAIEQLDASRDSFYEYQGVIFLKASDEGLLKEQGDILRRFFIQHGIRLIQERSAIEWYWFSRFPTYDKALRPKNLFARNLSILVAFKATLYGDRRSDWGHGALRHFWTSERQKFALQLHVGTEEEALAHSLTVAPSHGGKTTFFQHLIGGALRHKNLQAYIFDRFCGTEIFTRAMGGSYMKFTEQLSLNPFLCEPTPENVHFLTHFLRRMGKVSPDDPGKEIEQFVGLLFKVCPKDRRFETLYKSAFSCHSSLRSHIYPWAEGIHSHLFNGTQDHLDFSTSRLIGFDMTSLPKSPQVVETMMEYILHRIRSQVRHNNTPHLIFIDEAAPLLQDPYFSDHVQVLLREHRKLRGSINLCFQDAQSIATSPIRDTLLNQCPTLFLFPNGKARREDYEMFGISDHDWDYIKGNNNRSQGLPRSVLVKRSENSVILDVNLAPLGNHLYLYKSGISFQKVMQKECVSHGEEGWVSAYLEQYSKGAGL